MNHYCSFCRTVTIFDNNSTDSTLSIVKEEFPAVIVIPFSTDNMINDAIILDIKNNCWKGSTADYVIICDCDEFLFAENMQDRLIELKENKVTIPVIIGYNMGSETFPDDYNIPIVQQVKIGIRDRNFDKQIIFDPNKLIEINYETGCHVCNPVYKEKALQDKVVQFNLLHYKYLSKEYLYKRHAAYAERMSDFNIENEYAVEYIRGDAHIDWCFDHLGQHVYRVLQ